MDIEIVVGSSDSYADCYYPFFYFLNKYWPDHPRSIRLLTEYNDFYFEGFDIITSKNGFVPWGANMRSTLQQMDVDYVLLFMIDYFLQDYVQSDVFEHIGRAIRNNIDCLYFVPLNNHSSMSDSTGFVKLKQFADYKVNCQVALWKRQCLLRYLRNHESPHAFELRGTRRAWRRRDRFYMLDNLAAPRLSPCFNYPLAGVIRHGKWIMPSVGQQLREENITIDFNLRGVYEPSPATPSRWERLRRVLLDPAEVWSRIKSL